MRTFMRGAAAAGGQFPPYYYYLLLLLLLLLVLVSSAVSHVMMIIPLPHYESFLEQCWSRKICRSPPPPLPPPPPPPPAKLVFPPQFRTPSTNSFAYSQSETIFFFFFFFFFSPEPMIWIFMTCVFGIRVRMCVDLLFYCGEEKRKSTCTRKMHTTKFTCNEWRPPTAIQVVLYSHSCHWSWTITLVRGKLTWLH